MGLGVVVSLYTMFYTIKARSHALHGNAYFDQILDKVIIHR